MNWWMVFGREVPWVAMASLLCNGLLLVPTLYMLQVFDRVMVSPNGWTLLILTTITVAALLCMAFAEWLRSRLVIAVGNRLDSRIAARLFDQQIGRPDDAHPFDPERSLRDLAAVRQFLTGPAVLLLFDCPWIVLFVVVLFILHPWLGALAVLFSMALVGVAFMAYRRTDPLLAESGHSADLLDRVSHDVWRNRESLRAMGMRSALEIAWNQRHSSERSDARRATLVSELFQQVTRFLTHAQQAVVLAGGAFLAIRGDITPGAMIAANALATLATRPISSLVQNWRQVSGFRQAVQRVGKLLDDPVPPATPAPARQAGSSVVLRGVTRSVESRKKPIIDRVDLEVAPGEMVAVVGPSGAGKSTLLQCIVGAQIPDEGQVLCDGLGVGRWSQSDWRQRVGYLPQDPAFLEGTVAENIARLSSPVSDDVISAAKAADVHSLILRLRNGYDTSIGAAAEVLTPGHRQRLALARALFGKPSLLVLDEPGASLDELGQHALLRALDAARAAGVTVIMATHQRNLMARATQVVHLDGGIAVDVFRQQPDRTDEP